MWAKRYSLPMISGILFGVWKYDIGFRFPKNLLARDLSNSRLIFPTASSTLSSVKTNLIMESLITSLAAAILLQPNVRWIHFPWLSNWLNRKPIAPDLDEGFKTIILPRQRWLSGLSCEALISFFCNSQQVWKADNSVQTRTISTQVHRKRKGNYYLKCYYLGI